MEGLLDPYGDRVMKNVPMIAAKPLTKEELWHKCKQSKFNTLQ